MKNIGFSLPSYYNVYKAGNHPKLGKVVRSKNMIKKYIDPLH